MTGVVGTIWALLPKSKLPLHIYRAHSRLPTIKLEAAMAPGDVPCLPGTTVESAKYRCRTVVSLMPCYCSENTTELVIDMATWPVPGCQALAPRDLLHGTANDDVKNNLSPAEALYIQRLSWTTAGRGIWRRPESNIADLKNIGSSNAGMITAGRISATFRQIPWLHLDIAGPALCRVANGYWTKEGTRVSVCLLFDF